MSDKNQIFISYSHQDEFFVHNFVGVLREKLTANGLDDVVIWIDNRQMVSGQDWVQGVDSAIRDSFVVVLFMSPDAFVSPNVNYEWAFALGAQKYLIPISYRATELPAKLVNVRNIEVHRRKSILKAVDWDVLLADIKRFYDASKQMRGSEEMRQGIVQTLRTSDDSKELKDAFVLAQILEVEEALPELIRHALDSSDLEKQRAALTNIWRPLRAVEAKKLLRLLSEEGSQLSNLASHVLGRADEEIVPVLLEYLDDDNPKYFDGKPLGKIYAVRSVIAILERLKLSGGDWLGTFERLLGHDNSWVRGCAAESFGGVLGFTDVSRSIIQSLLVDKGRALFFEVDFADLYIQFDESVIYDYDHSVAAVSVITAVGLVLGLERLDEDVRTGVGPDMYRLLESAGFGVSDRSTGLFAAG